MKIQGTYLKTEIRPFCEQDISLIAPMQPEDWPDIIPVFSYYLKAPFCYPFSAYSGNNLIGIGTSVHYGSSAWIAHLIVHPDHRNRGAGTAILTHLCNFSSRHGIRTISLMASDMGYPVYLKAGFRVQAEYCRYCRSENMPKTCNPDVRRVTPETIRDVFALDRKVTGENRDNLLADYLNDAVLYMNNSSVTGFYLPALREGPVIASDMEAGKALLHYRASFTAYAVFPGDNDTVKRFYQDRGYAETRTIRRMCMGPEPVWYPVSIYNRAGGNFG